MKRFLLPFVVFVALAMAVVPCVSGAFSGQNGTITIGHIGENQLTWGDSLSLSGTSNVSANLILRLMGPGLPSDGVSLLNLNDTTGQPVSVGSDFSWTYIWRTSWTTGTIPTTGKYTIRASDVTYPDVYADFPLHFTLPAMTLNLTPTTIYTGDYSTVSGTTAVATDTVKVNVTKYGDTTVLKMYEADVDSSKKYNLPVRFSLASGKYNVTVTNPTDGQSLTAVLTIAEGSTPTATATATSTTVETVISTATATPAVTQNVSAGQTGTLNIDSFWILPIIIIIVVIIIIAAVVLYLKKGGGKRSRDQDL
ncbi:MAG: hypothetical protein ABFC24_03845 [Methanoregulaceae archaeon]